MPRIETGRRPLGLPAGAKATIVIAVAVLTNSAGCSRTQPEPSPGPDAFARIERRAFNRRAAQLGLPLFWIEDTNRNQAVDARELAQLWVPNEAEAGWTADGKLTARFAEVYEKLRTEPAPSSDRQKLVLEELSQGLPTLVYSDLSRTSPADQAFVRKVAAVARAVERAYRRQLGSAEVFGRLGSLDPISRALFIRNQAPWCMAPATQNQTGCNAFDTPSKPISGLYPPDLQADSDFCAALAKRDDAQTIFDRAHAVRRRDGRLVAVPYAEAFQAEMTPIADGLSELAEMADDDEALRGYLTAAAHAFRTNDWAAADRAWVKMADSSSRWYLRVAPDEVYFSPCGRKALVHLTLGRIDRSSRTWKRKLALVKSKMEQEIATLAGPPYRARSVNLKVPEFVNVILNAGDARRPQGAYIGQSLPNAGPLAEAGQQRTLAFSNLYSDPDSQKQFDRTVRSYFCADSVEHFSSASRPRIISTVLHDASFNLGPTLQYEVGGRAPPEIFGGPMANMLEELKAQSASLYFIKWLTDKGLVEPKVGREVQAFNLIWAFTHITRGVFGPGGRRPLHGHVGAIALGALLESGGLTWNADTRSANGEDQGCFSVDFERYGRGIVKLAGAVARIKARGDRGAAEALQKRYVDEGRKDLFEVIQTRGRRQPRPSFIYAFRTGDKE